MTGTKIKKLSGALKFGLWLLFIHIGLGPPLVGQSTTLIHAHNDYLQERPFWGAFEAGCASIEVDLILRDDTLFVAHEEESIESNKTFTTLYLLQIAKALDAKKVESPLVLLIDLKTASDATLPLVIAELQMFPSLIEASLEGVVTFTISGNRPHVSQYVEAPDFISFDYQSLKEVIPSAVSRIAMVSLSFKKFSSWDGANQMRRRDKKKIRKAVQFAHSLDKPFRLWGTPDTEEAWQTLADLGVDYVNTDQVEASAAYFMVGENAPSINH